MRTRKFTRSVLILTLVLVFATGCKNVSVTVERVPDDGLYLSEVLQIDLPDVVGKEEMAAALRPVTDREVVATAEEWSPLEAVAMAVTAAGFEELSLTYDDEKTASRWEHYKLSGSPVDDARTAVCALDTKLLTVDEADSFLQGTELKKDMAEQLVKAVARANGYTRNYLGYTDDPDIYGRMENAWKSFLLFGDGKLNDIGRRAVDAEALIGYNVKLSSYDARFLPENTVVYSHSKIDHAHQLIGLLNSEGLRAKVQLEPKVFASRYLLEEGEVLPEDTPTREVIKYTDQLYLRHVVEYDLSLEFDDSKSLERFHELVMQFAQKESEDDSGEGKLRDSGVQPRYKTSMPVADFVSVVECVLVNGMIRLQSYCLPEEADAVVASLKEIDPSLEVFQKECFVNPAFYQYLESAKK